MEREDEGIPPPYDVCDNRLACEEPVDAPPAYVNPKKKLWPMRFLSWFWEKVSGGSRENERPPKYMMEIVDIHGKVHYIDPDTPWWVVDTRDYSDYSDY